MVCRLRRSKNFPSFDIDSFGYYPYHTGAYLFLTLHFKQIKVGLDVTRAGLSLSSERFLSGNGADKGITEPQWPPYSCLFEGPKISQALVWFSFLFPST